MFLQIYLIKGLSVSVKKE